ncbi:MAG: hypothetical protein DRN17_00060 [Thermoplasmata archaeon]|nr:MAG: hypothetical protein DRN17_00060 [Thermoplasmata archaeon]
MVEEEWSLKGKLKARKALLNPKYEQYDNSFEIIDCYDRDDIEILRQKLIEDFENMTAWKDEKEEFRKIINKRFGVKHG